MEISEAALILGKYSLTYPNATMTKETIKVWHELFESETAENFLSAIRTACKEPGRQFFPTAGEVAAILKTIKHGPKQLAGDVWNLIIKSCEGGSYTKKDLINDLEGNEAAISATRQVGYNRIRLADIYDELPWIRKEFLKAYEEFDERNEQAEQVRIGTDEAKRILDRLPNINKLLGH